MIDRKRYLEICQINAIYPNSKKVKIMETEYFPQKLVIWFDKQGKTKNTCRMIDACARSVIESDINEIEEIT